MTAQRASAATIRYTGATMRAEKLEDCPRCGAWLSQVAYDRQQCIRCGYGLMPPVGDPQRALLKAATDALDTMRFAEVFVTSRQRIKKPEGEDMYREHMRKLAAALASYNAEAEGRG
ncbi:MAG: hypothetical protein RJQ08_13545 [Salinisphaeraceae bacterium]